MLARLVSRVVMARLLLRKAAGRRRTGCLHSRLLPAAWTTPGADRLLRRARHAGAGYGRAVPDALFADPRLAAIYDAFDGDRDDLDAYVAIADELGAVRVLDVGCGTGSLAVRLAATGRVVTGADPAEASLATARAKDPGGRVTWVRAGAAAVPEVGADLAVMTGNVAQVFLADEDWAGALEAIGRALRPGGHLVFETRRPERRGWL